MIDRLAADHAPGLGPELIFVGAALVFLSVFAIAFSNRLLRRVRSGVAYSLYRFGLAGRREGHLSALQTGRTFKDFLEALPWVTCRAAGVTPVTLFLLEGDGFVPAHSTRAEVESVPVDVREPLARTMMRSRWVHDLRGRSDDLENAPIYAVNGTQVEECRAVCAVPLRSNGTLYGFLLCGGSRGQDRLTLTSMAWLEGLGRLYSAWLARFEAAYVAGEALVVEPAPWPVQQEEVVAAMPMESVLRPAYVESSLETSRTISHSTDMGVSEPRMAGFRGGYETAD